MDRQNVSGQGHLIGFDPLTSQGGGDQCFTVGVGDSVEAKSNEGELDGTEKDGAHKCAGALCRGGGEDMVPIWDCRGGPVRTTVLNPLTPLALPDGDRMSW